MLLGIPDSPEVGSLGRGLLVSRVSCVPEISVSGCACDHPGILDLMFAAVAASSNVPCVREVEYGSFTVSP